MRILFISHNFIPQPTGEGSAIHISTIINTLKESGHEIYILIYGATDYSPMTGWKNEKKEILIQNLESKGVHSHILAKKDIPALQKENQVGNSILKSIQRIISPEPTDYYEGPYYWQEIKEYARSIKAEVLIAYSFEAVSAASALRGEIPLVASTVDLDHIVRRLRRPKLKTLNAKNILLDLYQRILLIRQPKVEVSLLQNCELVYSHAAQHCRWLQKHGVEKATYLPVAVPDHAIGYFSREKDVNNPLRIIMVGAVNNTATRMGIRYLTRHIVPDLDALWRKSGGFELQIYGGGKMDEETRKMLDFEWVKIMGYVDDIGNEFYNSDILLVPIPDNVGFRTRISEGFSYGCCVVTHAANTYGMPELEDNKNSLICRNTKEFILAISNCIMSTDLRKRLSREARLTYEEKLDGRKVGIKILSDIEEVQASEPANG